jgi:regulator of sirC expression with transglutaminase-like and TPR domain
MSAKLHFEAPTALDYFAALVADDASLPVLEAAVSIAQDEMPGLDVQGVLAQVDALADRLGRRLPADAPPLQRLRLLNRYFFQELGFGGNVNNYYDPANSLLPAVLESRRGIPISLAILYVEIAAQVGLPAHGIAFPGHFLVRAQMPRGDVVIDPFTGQSLSREELEERLLPYRQHLVARQEVAAPLVAFLQPAPGRSILARMLHNLREVYRSQGDWPRLECVQARLVVLLPQSWEEYRDHALVLARLGQSGRASQALAVYLQHRPQASDAAALLHQLQVWQGAAP